MAFALLEVAEAVGSEIGVTFMSLPALRGCEELVPCKQKFWVCLKPTLYPGGGDGLPAAPDTDTGLTKMAL